MPVPLEQFVKHLEDSGIIAGENPAVFQVLDELFERDGHR
jgi:hypothetical protein